MKAGNKDEILLFFEQYFTDEEELETLNQKKAMIQSAHKGLTPQKIEDLKFDELMGITTKKDIVGIVISHWVWDMSNLPNKPKAKKFLEITPDKRSIYIKEEAYIFRNFFGTVAFNEGIHYWEIVADARTEHELKIGVSSINKLDQGEESK